ncbi:MULTISPECIES: alpha-hydroxy-acid oxidizing protein [unclassified Mesorhizobium]|uniref:alpha-hydroxy-acid oxidizing protein n=1 Tax=unclassified Mesorhizobium TaxID=325217 RepID=UPI001FE07CCE|nr:MULTISPECIES: alpha-hydroxy-acid oxidizing protein [unclassified Mesorhizobium]
MTRLDTGITLFGQSLPHPIILAPIAYLRLVHPEARWRRRAAPEWRKRCSLWGPRRCSDRGWRGGEPVSSLVPALLAKQSRF